ALAVALEGPGGVLVLAGEVEEFLHLVGGDGAGHLARRVPAHAVEDGEDVLLGKDEQVVLVVVALHADVGLGCVEDLHVRAGLRRLAGHPKRGQCGPAADGKGGRWKALRARSTQSIVVAIASSSPSASRTTFGTSAAGAVCGG